VLLIEGAPRIREYASFHRATRTLIVGDLVFNFGPNTTGWTKWFFQKLGGIQQYPGIGRLYRSSIRDREAFRASVRRILQWDFARLIPGHGDVIESGAKPKLAAALEAAGFQM
jgi:glyoxylase-like metal-dependent hydrolase (beta-lactamase superfamily II)